MGRDERLADHDSAAGGRSLSQEPSLFVLSDFDRWVSQWDQLVDLSPLPSPFQRSCCLIGTGELRPRFLLVVDDDRLVDGVALQEGRRFGLSCFRMLGAGPLCVDSPRRQ